MIDKSSLLKSQGSLYLEFIPKDGLFPKMLLLSLMGFLTGWCNLIITAALRSIPSPYYSTCNISGKEYEFSFERKDILTLLFS